MDFEDESVEDKLIVHELFELNNGAVVVELVVAVVVAEIVKPVELQLVRSEVLREEEARIGLMSSLDFFADDR